MKTIFFSILFIIHFSFIASLSCQVGDPAPDFTVTDVHGKKHKLYEDYIDKGKKVVLDFFFTTCTPCIYYSPQVTKAYEKYGCNTQDVVFLSIDYDDTDAEVIQYENMYLTEYPTASGKSGGGNAVVSQYQIQAFPSLLLIDSTKKIIAEFSPPTLVVFDFIFAQHGLTPKTCLTKTNDQVNDQLIFVYPNPSNEGKINVHVSNPINDDAHFEILDYNGKTLYKFTNTFFGESDFSLDVDNIPPGSYILKLCERNYKPLYSKITLIR